MPDTTNTTERVTVVESPLSLGLRWRPSVGKETLDLFSRSFKLDPISADTVRGQALEILGRCLPPTAAAGAETGLVVGYVQSGKTMSFTTVTALARDNDYHLVIVIAGTSKPLFRQSTDRLVRDLRYNDRPDRKWHLLSSDSWGPQDTSGLRARLLEWRNERFPHNERRTVLVTVMKHHGHLGKVIRALRELDLEGTKALIVDDEADQASLNTLVTVEEQSTTYQKLLELRSLLPHHSFIQYTATPQAPLLINIIDALSPRFVQVLTAGPEYVGGKDFFISRTDLTQVIPECEIPSDENALVDPPESLLTAMRVFFLGVAAGRVLDGGVGNRSMMVHPSQPTVGHKLYYRWVTAIRDSWERLLGGPEGSPDRREILDSFQRDYEQVASSAIDMPGWTAIADRLCDVLRATKIVEVNASKSGKTPHINWRDEYSHILVGGQAMDRGFTVEGLTVTYMPRSLGVGNADTVQQRARFFGYKRKYLGYCRVFLPASALSAYTSYVRHEEDVRDRLIQFALTGQPLSNWKRAFHLDPTLRPTRQNVLDLEYMRVGAEQEWYAMERPHLDPSSVGANQGVVRRFAERLAWAESPGDSRRSDTTRHNEATCRLSRIVEDLLTQLQCPYVPDSQRFVTLSLLLREYLERSKDIECVVFDMSQGRARERTLDEKGRIKNLFQGAVPVTPKPLRGSIYAGDQKIADGRDTVVVQLHSLDIFDSDQAKKDGTPLAASVPCIAVFLPADMSHDLLVQTDVRRAPTARWHKDD